MAKKTVNQKTTGKQPATPAQPSITIDRAEYASIVLQLKECTHAFIDAWATAGEIDSFDRALVKLHAARRNLETATNPQFGELFGGAS